MTFCFQVHRYEQQKQLNLSVLLNNITFLLSLQQTLYRSEELQEQSVDKRSCYVVVYTKPTLITNG